MVVGIGLVYLKVPYPTWALLGPYKPGTQVWAPYEVPLLLWVTPYLPDDRATL